ncbi:MAG: DUF4278 domain-containing protein [Cyanobacteria bacterium J06635_1]
MLLTYRGVSYNYTPNPMPKFAPVYAMGSYRGAPVSFYALAEVPEQLSFDLTWRGVPYRSGPTVQIATAAEPVAATPVTTSESAAPNILERMRNLVMRRHRRIRQREQSMLGRLNEEVGLTAEDATQYESEIQGKTPHDFGGYDRSHKAMS